MAMKQIFKVVLLGDQSVGKTSIRKKYMGDGFSSSYLPTLGADFAVKSFGDGEQTHSELQIWDIGGQKSFEVLIHRFIKNSDSAIFVFSMDRKSSIESMETWLDAFVEENKENLEHIPIVFFGNKNDLDNHEVTDEDIAKLTQMFKSKFNREEILFFRTSALTGENIDTAFETLMDILKS